jgi:4-methyl-5(b-hydroxyethyl)-thiazole monophosphate biosynthesis
MIYALMADGFEEIEALAVVDILRRANIKVEVVGLRDLQLTGSRGVTILCDEVFDYYSTLEYDGVVMVGGMNNATSLSQDDRILKLLQDYMERGKMIAGICATPSLVFSEAGILSGKRATCYPGCESDLFGATYTAAPVEQCGNIITACGPGVSFDFGFAIVERLCGKEIVDTLCSQMQF